MTARPRRPKPTIDAPDTPRGWMPRLGGVGAHLAAIAALLIGWFPAAKFWFTYRPLFGIDFYLSVDFLTYLQRHFAWPWNGWKYIWYGGNAWNTTYPLWNTYVMLPLTRWFNPHVIILFFTLTSYALFLVFTYFLLYRIARSRVLAVALALAMGYSANYYSAWVWGGSHPYLQTIYLLPLTLWLVLVYLEERRPRLLYLAALFVGVGALIHPLSIVGWTLPLAIGLQVLWRDHRTRLFDRWKFKHLLGFLLVAFFVGFPQFASNTSGGPAQVIIGYLRSAISGSKAQFETVRQAVVNVASETAGSPFYRLLDALTWTNRALVAAAVVGLVLMLVGLALGNRRDSFRRLLVFLPLILYGPAFLLSFAAGVNPFSGGWYRVFWPIAFLYGIIAAVGWRVLRDGVAEHGRREHGAIARWFPRVSLGVLLMVGIAVGVWYGVRDVPAQRKHALDFQQVSSAFPIDLNFPSGVDWRSSLPPLVPSWLPANQIDYRMYSDDATITIWWNAVFDMPQARGYLDSPGGPNYASWQYLQDVSISKNELAARLGYPVDLAKNTALYFLDWHAIKYSEAGSGFARNYATALSTYLVPEFADRSESLVYHEQPRTFVQEGRYWQVNVPYDESLTYYKFKDAVTSPIFQASTAPRLGVVADANGQDTVMRLLAARNLNSQKLISVQLPPSLKGISDEQLGWFDALFLYRYNLSPADWGRLEQYVERGGHVFVDTGTEQRESTTNRPPQLFPVSALTRGTNGSAWNLLAPGSLAAGLDLKNFGPLTFQEQPWSLSAAQPGDVESGAVVELAHDGLPVLVSQRIGSGSVVWSGMNLPYHLRQYLAKSEIVLFDRLMERLVGTLAAHPYRSTFERPRSELVRISGMDEPTVLFKEAAFPGWSASIKGATGSRRLPILRSGPMDPGYMVVAVPPTFRGKPYTVTFRYAGPMMFRIQWGVMLLALVLSVLGLLFPRRAEALLRRFARHGHRGVRSWWNRDDPDAA